MGDGANFKASHKVDISCRSRKKRRFGGPFGLFEEGKREVPKDERGNSIIRFSAWFKEKKGNYFSGSRSTLSLPARKERGHFEPAHYLFIYLIDVYI